MDTLVKGSLKAAWSLKSSPLLKQSGVARREGRKERGRKKGWDKGREPLCLKSIVSLLFIIKKKKVLKKQERARSRMCQMKLKGGTRARPQGLIAMGSHR